MPSTQEFINHASYHRWREVRVAVTRQPSLALVSDSDGWTALQWAALRGHYPTVERLIAHRADVNASNNQLSTALHWACRAGHIKIVEFLCHQGAYIYRRNKVKTYSGFHDTIHLISCSLFHIELDYILALRWLF